MPMLGLLVGLGIAGILWVGGHRMADGILTLGEFIAFISYLSLMTWPMSFGLTAAVGVRVPSVEQRVAARNKLILSRLRRCSRLRASREVSAPDKSSAVPGFSLS